MYGSNCSRTAGVCPVSRVHTEGVCTERVHTQQKRKQVPGVHSLVAVAVVVAVVVQSQTAGSAHASDYTVNSKLCVH